MDAVSVEGGDIESEDAGPVILGRDEEHTQRRLLRLGELGLAAVGVVPLDTTAHAPFDDVQRSAFGTPLTSSYFPCISH